MKFKNRTQDTTYFSKSNNLSGVIFTIVLSIIVILLLRINIQSITILFIWIIIQSIIAYRNIKKGCGIQLSEIKDISIKNNVIKFNINDGSSKNYRYCDIKQIDLNIETYTCHSRGTSQPSIKDTQIVFLFNDNNKMSMNIYYYSRMGFISNIRKIINEFKSIKNINIKYSGKANNISEIKELIEYSKKHNKPKFFSNKDLKDCRDFALMTLLFGPIITVIFAILCIELDFISGFILLLKSFVFFLIIATIISFPIILNYIKLKMNTNNK